MKGGEVFDHFMLCALEANLFLILGQFIFQGLRKIITIAKDINWTGLIVDKPISLASTLKCVHFSYLITPSTT